MSSGRPHDAYVYAVFYVIFVICAFAYIYVKFQ